MTRDTRTQRKAFLWWQVVESAAPARPVADAYPLAGLAVACYDADCRRVERVEAIECGERLDRYHQAVSPERTRRRD